MQALIPKLKKGTHCFPAGFLSNVLYSQIGKQLAVFDAHSDRETSLVIRGDPKNGRRAEMMQIKGTAQQCVRKPFPLSRRTI